jgi:hypothetical protein
MREWIYVAADWSGLESRLVAYFSGDENLRRMHEEELTGGHKVHSITAGVLYNIDPGDAKTYRVNLQGQDRPAYDAGKRLRHGWQYGMKERKMAQTFWISPKEATRVNETLSEMHPRIPKWWEELGDEVFGVASYVCVRCGNRQRVSGSCEECPRRPGSPGPRVEFGGWDRHPSRVHYTPLGRRRLYLGRRSEGMNALISQDPQSTGTSMWYRSGNRLHGRDGARGMWPVPPGTLVFSGSYGELTTRGLTSVDTGTYDSFLTATLAERRDVVLQWMAWTLEQPWPQLGGLRIPVELKTGGNWGERREGNPTGLCDVDYRPLSATRPDGLDLVPV